MESEPMIQTAFQGTPNATPPRGFPLSFIGLHEAGRTGRKGGELETMTTSRKKKTVGFVVIRQGKDGRWRARFKHPLTGADVRRVLPVADEADAILKAKAISEEIAANKGFVPRARRPKNEPDALTVADALAESIRMTRGNEGTRARYTKDVNYFTAFLKKSFPNVDAWRDVRPSMLAEFVRDMQGRGLAYDTIRLRLVPLIRASRYWADEKPELYRDIARMARRSIDMQRPPVAEIHVLTPEQLGAFLDWLKVNRPALYPMAALAGLAGLRVMEAASLRYCDVDFKGQTVAVTKTETHKPKNRGSWRTIPVIPAALEPVAAYLDTRKVQGMAEAAIFLHSKGEPWTLDNLSRSWRRTIKAAKDVEGLEFLKGFQAHQLRATFATMARGLRTDERTLKRYIGHTPGDVLGAHYEALDVDAFKREIVNPLAKSWGQIVAKLAGENGSKVAIGNP